ncbi:type VI lipase adapter Tla3 domain-containing protein [Paraburkholderia pallida]|uniref:DUF2875 domain-containing protein n=1 Tax=Paraburkholderia pallida TaxID=2547399 RepID=A0A4P7CUZ1_9BURK|nr:DUF2875 family protein [Paraburkholderia pallida]QBQ99107.1 DUF2875 domain-containing protein [Paraburkholderia pallida]
MNTLLRAPSRPKFWPYVLVLVVVAISWVGYQLFRSHHYWELTGLQDPDMGRGIRNGVVAIVAMGGFAFFGHWMMNASGASSGAKPSPAVAAPAVAPAAAVADPSMNPEVARVLAGTGEKYALEIRSVGLVVKGTHQANVWKFIQEKANNYETFLSRDPKDYGSSPDERRIFSNVASNAAFGYAAAKAVHDWPVPVIIVGPPNTLNPNAYNRAAAGIVDGRNGAGLGATEFLWLDDHNTTNAAASIAELFDFFDKHPDVPAALILSRDGMQYRLGLTPGTAPEPREAAVPPIPDSMGGLLVARTDRVDQRVRPYAVKVPGEVDTRDTQYDVIKQWNFYWDKNNQFGDDADKAIRHVGTMKADWWISQLPELWQHIGNQGPGDFKPSPYLPVRWTDWQLEQFDVAPRLGYLHRPVQVKLTGDDGKPLKRAEEVARLQQGWQQALGTLHDGTKPSRVFYDTTLDRQWVIPLTQALHGNAQGIDLGDVKDGYDIGRRIGDTGVSSALVQLCLATIAGYEDGQTSATVNLVDGHSASIVMVSPPDAASKAMNEKNASVSPLWGK